MKNLVCILLLSFLLFGSSAQAQFNKPLSSTNRTYSSEAKYNIGLVGGLTSTYWVHFGGTKTPYREPLNFGIIGGLSVERILDKNLSISLEGYYAMRNLQLNYEVVNFPDSLNVNNNYYRQLNVDFREINVQAPITYYLSKSNIRPYIFIAPRVSVPLSGTLKWQKTKILNYGATDQHLSSSSLDTVVEMNAQNTWQWNIGLVAGAGVMFKLNVGNYYFLIKADVSAHAALAYFNITKGFHASFLNSYTYDEQNNENLHVVGAGYIDPYLLGLRLNTDAAAKVTIMFPLKKQLKGACMRWGEYD